MSPRKVRVREGMLIGAAVGVVAGFLLGAADDSRAQSDPDASCDHCFEVLGATVYGAIGLGLGAAVAAIIPNGNP